MRLLARTFALVVIAQLAACAARGPHLPVAPPDHALDDRTTHRLVSAWQDQVAHYIETEGQGDPAVLSQMGVARSQNVARPGRILFGALDVEANVPGRDGYDVRGLLTGKQTIGPRNWYFFVVGVVQRKSYRPTYIADIRVVGLSAEAGKLSWTVSATNPQSLDAYRNTFGEDMPIQFPSDTDAFSVEVGDKRIVIRELRSGAQWSLPVASEIHT